MAGSERSLDDMVKFLLSKLKCNHCVLFSPLFVLGGSHTKIVAAAVGLFAGLVLLLVIVVAYRKRVSVCQTFSRGT